MVLVDPYVQELATLITEMVMTALNTEGSPLTPAYFMARTKGDALVFAPEEFRRSGELFGTMMPIMSNEMT